MIPGVNVFDVGWVTLTLTHHSRRRGSRRISGRHRVGLDVELNLEGGKASWQNKKGPKVNNRWRWEENPTYSRSLTKGLAQLILDHPKGGLKAKFILFDPTLSRCETRKNPLTSAEYSGRRYHTIQNSGEVHRWNRSTSNAWII
jgi:hypothetical protein